MIYTHDNFDFVIAIPTYKRYELIKEKTLAYLHRCGIDPNKINLFVNDGAEMKKYVEEIGENGYGYAITGMNTVKEKFNAIHRWFFHGTNVIVMEDDIDSIKYTLDKRQLHERHSIIDDWIHAFNLCNIHNTKLWGISSNSNPYFLQDKSGPCFKLCVANMFGFIAENPPIQVTQETKTDYERTILYTRKYGHVVRLDYLCPITKNYKNPGGMQELGDDLRYLLESESVEYLAKTYPDLCRKNSSKTSKFLELSLITKRVTPKSNLF